jgi:ribosomal protein L12E/L44/L45/RPP1/RPP2
VTEEAGHALDDFIAFVAELEGKAPDMDEVMENALDALFRRAKGFAAWRKSRLSAPVGDDEIEGALASLVTAGTQHSGASSGARGPR